MTFRWQMLRAGRSKQVTDSFFIWGVLGVIIGSRLGHCLFYEPGYYLTRPWEILFVWKGGLASHGATLGLILTLYLFGRKYKIKFLEMLDCFAMAATCGAIFVRLGNFMNSEIVGRITDVPWAVKFVRFQDGGMYPRHPSQLYEAFMAIVVLIVLLLVDRKFKERRPNGLLIGIFFALYFTFRFIVEFFKEWQTLAHFDMAQRAMVPEFGLTMGQLLSIPFILLGYGMLFWIWKNRGKHREPPESQPKHMHKPASRKKSRSRK